MAGLVLVDCASSGTKMYLAVQRARGGHVSNIEIRSLPGVLEALAQLRGQAPADRHELVAGFREGLREAIAKSHRLTPAVPVLAVVVGLTSFWRPLTFGQRADVFHHVLQRLEKVARSLTRAPIRFEPLSEGLEALLERQAVVYAATHSRLGCKSVDLVVSGGNNGVNFTPPENFAAPPTSVSLNLFKGKVVVKEQGIKVWQSECIVQLDRAAGLYCGELEKQDPPPEEIVVIAIGSIYWGGKFAGLATDLKEMPLEEVLQRFAAQLEAALLPTAAAGSGILARLSSHLDAGSPNSVDTKQTGGSDWFRDLANLIRVKACFERLFPAHLRHLVRVVFARDWVIKGEKFRTTWTSGYFVKNCVDEATLFTPSGLLSSPTIAPAQDAGWLDLSSEASAGFESVLCFDDQEDLVLHEEPYSRRTQLLPIMPAQLHSYSEPAVGELVWSRVAVSSAVLGLGGGEEHIGIELNLPAADEISRFVVVGLVQCGSAGAENGARSSLPCPALGFNRRLKSLFPVVDLGVIFDAKSATVSLQRGAVQKRRSTFLGTRHFPWDPKTKDTYHVWLERSTDGRAALRLAKGRAPVLYMSVTTGRTEEYGYPFSESFLELPVAVHVWVGAVSKEPGDICSASWRNLEFATLPSVPSDCRWRCGRLGASAGLAVERVRHHVQSKLPAWLAKSFRPHHDGEEGVRRLAAWPPSANAGPDCPAGAWPGFVATAGEADLWIFSGHGENMYHCRFLKATVWSVAILDVRTTLSLSTVLRQPSLEIRILVGCEGARMLEELHVIVDDPGEIDVCMLKERTIAGAGDQVTNAWCGHTGKVTGICVDHTRGLVYTVSEDKSVAQWDKSGRLLFQAKGWHSLQIYNCALSPDGLWLATAGFDHVALFSADTERGLACAALIVLNWGNHDLVRRWFSVAFLPKSIADEEETASELPSALLVGDMRGGIWLVSLRSHGERRETSGMVAFISASTAGIPLQPHLDCVRHLCWIEGDTLGSPVVAKRTQRALRCRRCGSSCGCRRSLQRLFRRSSLQDCTESNVELSMPLLCSMSSDRTVHVFDGEDVRKAYRWLMQTQTERSPHSPKYPTSPFSPSVKPSVKPPPLNSKRSSRRSLGKAGFGGMNFALEIAIHTGPVRAAGVDAYGRLYTASRHIAQWDELDKYYRGDDVLEPKLFIREALLLEVTIYFANILFFAVQLLYFSSNRGSFTTDTQAKTTVAPIAALSKLSVLQPIKVHSVSIWPFWRTVFFLLVALMVLVCPNILKTYYDAEMKYDLDPDDVAKRIQQMRKKMRRKIQCYIISFLLFSVLVIPTFEEFAMLLNCPKFPDGTRRMAANQDTVCFVDTHLVMTVACVVFGVFYLACGLLFETVNFNLRSLMESKLGEQAAFPPSTKYSCGRAVSLRRLVYVMFRHLVPDVNLEMPQVKVGVFTETDWAVHSRQVRFVSKVLLAGCDKMEPLGASLQMTATTCIALFNLLIIVTFPPLKDPRIRRMLELLHVSVFFASATALAALWGPSEQSPNFTPTLAVVYVVFAFAPLVHVTALAIRRRLRPPAADSAKVAVEPYCGSPASSGQLAPGERLGSLGRVAWDDPSTEDPGLRRTAAAAEELDLAAAKVAARRQPFVPDCRLETPTSSGEDMPSSSPPRQALPDRQKTIS